METDLEREHNGRTILNLCAMGDAILRSFGMPYAVAPCTDTGCPAYQFDHWQDECKQLAAWMAEEEAQSWKP